ncbi:hypothetical protein CI105_08955 [Candidatus Izimaplasma bacterium ZiA1]|uniref:NERD domain-containing protein n=1 Tax=Candidatus Izimoplasma sp. ZiA1 TaxID=2024899 RepID=UPI000BAA50D9|nr:hypothetical protein CI105_08955 [Candidatus Izimaplasma bacterium ZiA1]
MTNKQKRNLESKILNSNMGEGFSEYFDLYIETFGEVGFVFLKENLLFNYFTYDSAAYDKLKYVGENITNYKVGERVKDYVYQKMKMVFIHKIFNKLYGKLKKEILSINLYLYKKPHCVNLKRSILALSEDLVARNGSAYISVNGMTYTFEEIIDGVSLIINEVDSSVIYKNGYLPYKILNDKKKIYKLLDYALSIVKLRDYEFLLDMYDYRVKVYDNHVSIDSDSELNKSYNLGFVMNNLRKISNSQIINNPKYPRRREMLNHLKKTFPEDVYLKKKDDYGVKRYVIFYIDKLFYVFNKMVSNVDDQPLLKRFYQDFLIDTDDIDDFFVFDDISILNILQFKRVFDIIHLIYMELYNKNDNVRRINSLIQIIKVDDLSSMNDQLGYIDDTKFKKILSFFTQNDDISYLDLFYTPFIKFMDDRVMFSPHICSTSDLLRSSIILSRRKGIQVSNNYEEKLTNKLYKTFVSKGFKVFKNVEFSFEGKKHEVDCIVLANDYVFFFECKTTISAASIYETRTNMKQINKGVEQLSEIKDIANLNDVLKTKSIEIRDLKRIYNVVTTSYHLVSHNYNGIRILNAYDFVNFIDSGKVTINNDVYSLWKNTNLSQDDMLEYCQCNAMIIEIRNALTEFDSSFHVLGNRFSYVEYGLDVEKFINKIKMTNKTS